MKYILNSPVMTSYGTFKFFRIEEHEAIEWLEKADWESAVGHESTATFVSERLGRTIPFQRKTIRMRPGDEALILRVMSRLPQDPKSMTNYDIQQIGLEYGLVAMSK